MVKDTDTVYSYTGAYLFLRPRAHVSLDDGFPTTRGEIIRWRNVYGLRRTGTSDWHSHCWNIDLLAELLSRFGADINLTITLILNSWNFTADHVGRKRRR